MSDNFSVQSLIGETKEAAAKLAKAAGFSTRVVENDGKSFMVTMDLRKDRINLYIKNGKVEKAEIG